jgi:hypothetical protein
MTRDDVLALIKQYTDANLIQYMLPTSEVIMETNHNQFFDSGRAV